MSVYAYYGNGYTGNFVTSDDKDRILNT